MAVSAGSEVALELSWIKVLKPDSVLVCPAPCLFSRSAPQFIGLLLQPSSLRPMRSGLPRSSGWLGERLPIVDFRLAIGVVPQLAIYNRQLAISNRYTRRYRKVVLTCFRRQWSRRSS